MSLLSTYVAKEQQLKELREELQKLESDSRLQQELKFKSQLEALIEEYGKTTSEVIQMLSPKPSDKSSTGTRKKRKLKVYKNPHTEEVIETRGGNHKVLKQWKEEYGPETVEEWIQE